MCLLMRNSFFSVSLWIFVRRCLNAFDLISVHQAQRCQLRHECLNTEDRNWMFPSVILSHIWSAYLTHAYVSIEHTINTWCTNPSENREKIEIRKHWWKDVWHEVRKQRRGRRREKQEQIEMHWRRRSHCVLQLHIYEMSKWNGKICMTIRLNSFFCECGPVNACTLCIPSAIRNVIIIKYIFACALDFRLYNKNSIILSGVEDKWQTQTVLFEQRPNRTLWAFVTSARYAQNSWNSI